MTPINIFGQIQLVVRKDLYSPPLLSVPGVKGRGHSKGVRVDVVTAPIEVDVVLEVTVSIMVVTEV